MKTNYVDMKQRYELAHRQVWAKLPEWKQKAIGDNLKNGKTDSRFYNEFIAEVALLAEDTNVELSVYKKVELPTVASTETSSVEV